jgi:hypothetical protein
MPVIWYGDMVMLYEGGLKKLTTTRYPVYLVMSYSVSRTEYIVGYVVLTERICLLKETGWSLWMLALKTIKPLYKDGSWYPFGGTWHQPARYRLHQPGTSWGVPGVCFGAEIEAVPGYPLHVLPWLFFYQRVAGEGGGAVRIDVAGLITQGGWRPQARVRISS